MSATRRKANYKVLFNDDGFCTFSNASRYQDINKPVCMEQVNGYVDEVADAGCDVFLLCPNIYQLPGWDSDHDPFWKGKGKTVAMPDTVVGKIVGRVRDFILAGNGLIALSRKRAKAKGMAFFITWRMNECHGIEDTEHPWISDFYRDHPAYRTGSYDYPGWNAHLALNFQHKEVRDYQFGFIRELCERYELDGLELDFLRWPYYFPKSAPFDERSDILAGFIRRVREMLDGMGKNIPICVRVQNRVDDVLEMGLDLKKCADDGLIDMVNISPFYISDSESDIEAFRSLLPRAKLYAELTQSTDVLKHIELSVENSRKSTTEFLRSTAYSFLERGADGISLFNFVYYRDYSFGNPVKLDKCEPNYPALIGITDKKKLAQEPKHYVLSSQQRPYCKQLPREIKKHRRVELRIHVADKLGDPETSAQFSRSILRLQADGAWGKSTITARLHGRQLKPVMIEGELFPNPYEEGIPDSHACYLDFEVPINLLAKGWNSFVFFMDDGDAAVIRRMELALYR